MSQALQLAAAVEALTSPGEPLLLGVSGGSDSVAVLAALVVRERNPIRVAHVHHGLRAAADRDAASVAGLCRDLRTPFLLLHAPPGPGPAARTETAARVRRLAALSQAARSTGAPWIVLGHHRDDSRETVLLNLRRGHRGLRAWAGIPSVRAVEPGLSILRPALLVADGLGRAELAAIREAAGLPHVVDETNTDPSVARNALRAELDRGVEPLTAQRLDRLRRLARARLEDVLARAAGVLAATLESEGQGACLRREGWQALLGGTELAVEGLRLLGHCLLRPVEIRLSSARIGSLCRQARSTHGEVLLAGRPRGLRGRLTGKGIHFPSEPLAPGPPVARVLIALARLPLHPRIAGTPRQGARGAA